jgi:nitrogen regulatory protein PII
VRHEGLTKMTKVEVVVAGTEVPAVRELCRSAGATGWTSLSGVSGLGHHGLHQGRLLFNEHDTLELLITVVPDERADALLAGLRELLEEASGVMFVSDTWVSRPEHFR